MIIFIKLKLVIKTYINFLGKSKWYNSIKNINSKIKNNLVNIMEETKNIFDIED